MILLFVFENYVTKLKGSFNVLEMYGVNLYVDKNAEHLLDHITSPNIEQNTEVNIFSLSQYSTFFKPPT